MQVLSVNSVQENSPIYLLCKPLTVVHICAGGKVHLSYAKLLYPEISLSLSTQVSIK